MIVKQQPNLLLLPKPEIIKDTTFRYNFMGLVISTRFFQRWVATAFSGIKIQCIKKLWWMVIPKFPDSDYCRNFMTGFSHLKFFMKISSQTLIFTENHLIMVVFLYFVLTPLPCMILELQQMKNQIHLRYPTVHASHCTLRADPCHMSDLDLGLAVVVLNY